VISHKKYRGSGQVWQGRSNAFLIQEDEHLVTVSRAVERNPVRAALVRRAENRGRPRKKPEGH